MKNSKNKDNLVYQYLPYSAFEKMILNKTIKLSNIRRSNDTTELDYGSNIYKSTIFEELNKEKEINKNNKNYFIKEFSSRVEHIDDYNEKIAHTQFVSCFSKNGDMLSQWRGYTQETTLDYEDIQAISKANKDSKKKSVLIKGKNCGGVSVGFSKEKLVSLAKKDKLLLSCNDVLYTVRRQKKLLRDSAKRIIKEYKKCLYDKTEINIFWSGLQTEYENTLINIVPYIKNPFFKEEKEFRICHWDSFLDMEKTSSLEGKSVELSNKIFVREYKKRLNSDEPLSIYEMYFYINMGEKINSFIKHIVIGPKCIHSKDEIEKFIRANNIKCEISYSIGFNTFVDSPNRK